tara:strand:- start:68 stop:349 length:282 start_codon:yes stop_codon:yes gene_type:complete
MQEKRIKRNSKQLQFKLNLKKIVMRKEVLTIKATPNHSKRTFTIRKYYDGKLFAKYRTVTMGIDEFESSENHTLRDWKDFFRGDDYYEIKVNY